MLKNYVLTYDAFQLYQIRNELMAFVQSNALTYQFFSPYLGCILIKSASDILSLSHSYNSFFDGKHFFIAEVEATQAGGRQLPELWSWLNNSNPMPVPFIPIGPA